MASWFLKYIIVHDMQTKEKFYFLCQKWLAVEREDGQIERDLFVACDAQKTELKYLIQSQVSHTMNDSHLWYSIFARPVYSTFTRIDRVTCCFVLLFISMLLDILYYGMNVNQTSDHGLHWGPFSVTLEQVNINNSLLISNFKLSIINLMKISVGILTNLFSFPPGILLVQMFRRSTKKRKLAKNDSRMTKSFRLPWWCKLIAYIVSLVTMALCATFIIFRGINHVISDLMN
jgi:hypothetical protein